MPNQTMMHTKMKATGRIQRAMLLTKNGLCSESYEPSFWSLMKQSIETNCD